MFASKLRAKFCASNLIYPSSSQHYYYYYYYYYSIFYFFFILFLSFLFIYLFIATDRSNLAGTQFETASIQRSFNVKTLNQR